MNLSRLYDSCGNRCGACPPMLHCISLQFALLAKSQRKFDPCLERRNVPKEDKTRDLDCDGLRADRSNA